MEDKKQFNFILLIVIIIAVVGAIVSLAFSNLVDVSSPQLEVTDTTANIGLKSLEENYVFNPPPPDEAPDQIRDAVILGYNIIVNTQEYVPEYVGNDLTCTNCHFEGGMSIETLSLVGVAAKYPKYRSRQDFAADLETRSQGCFERSMNGKALPHGSKEMAAIMAYYHWISRGIPIYADIPWLGLKKLESDHKPDKEKGEKVWANVCSPCHGIDGHGTPVAPPVWGPGSFNDGAGMSDVKNMAPFAYLYMPKDNPYLTKEEALDVAAYATVQPRPHFTKKKNDQDKW